MQPECAKPTTSRSSATSATASSTGAASRPRVDAASRSLISSRAGYNPSPPLRARLSVVDQLRESHHHKTFTHLRESLEIYIGLNDSAMIGRSFTELADSLIWAGRFQKAIELARRGLQKDVSADRVRLLATLGHAYATTAKLRVHPRSAARSVRSHNPAGRSEA